MTRRRHPILFHIRQQIRWWVTLYLHSPRKKERVS